MSKVMKLDRHVGKGSEACKREAKRQRVRAMRRAGKRLDDAKRVPYHGWVS